MHVPNVYIINCGGAGGENREARGGASVRACAGGDGEVEEGGGPGTRQAGGADGSHQSSTQPEEDRGAQQDQVSCPRELTNVNVIMQCIMHGSLVRSLVFIVLVCMTDSLSFCFYVNCLSVCQYASFFVYLFIYYYYCFLNLFFVVLSAQEDELVEKERSAAAWALKSWEARAAVQAHTASRDAMNALVSRLNDDVTRSLSLSLSVGLFVHQSYTHTHTHFLSDTRIPRHERFPITTA